MMPVPIDKKKKLTPDVRSAWYRECDRSELARQGADHLQGRTDVRVRRAGHVVRVAAWTVILAALVLGAAFCGWLLITAQHSGQTFSAVREQALHAYDELGE